MVCKNCGRKMEPSWRCCLSCGTLNDKYKETDIETLTLEEDYKINSTMCSVNFVLYILLVILLSSVKFDIPVLDSFWIKLSFITVIFFYLFCKQILFEKAKVNWWKIYIPLYNIYLMFKLAYGKGIHLLSLFVPALLMVGSNYVDSSISNYILIASYVCLGIIIISLISNMLYKFGKRGIINTLLFIIMIPIVAFDNKYSYHEDY